jgi:hypothetical protein
MHNSFRCKKYSTNIQYLYVSIHIIIAIIEINMNNYPSKITQIPMNQNNRIKLSNHT